VRDGVAFTASRGSSTLAVGKLGTATETGERKQY